MVLYKRLNDTSILFPRNAFLYLICFFLIFIIFVSIDRSQNVIVPVPFEPIQVRRHPKEQIWDTLDGIGYNFKLRTVTLDPRFEILNNLPTCDLQVDKENPRVNIEKVMEDFQKCINPIVGPWKNDIKAINSKWEKTAPCDSVFGTLDVIRMDNMHETKWTILPTCKEDSGNTMVTLGVGHDTMAEEKLNQTLPNTNFYGADPIIEPNRQLYSQFGKFFPFAIGRKPGFTKFRVLPNQNQKTRKYEFQDVTTIPLDYFLSDILGLKRIDIVWFDIEGGEFEFLDLLHRGEILDKKGVSICQFNIEIHSKFFPSGAPVFHDFIFRVLEEKRYVFLKPARTEPGVHRMFFVNFENQECVRKFLQ